MKYRYVLFDLDGTLLDTSLGVISAVKRMLLDQSLPPIPDETLLTFIGPPIEVSLKAHYDLPADTVSFMAGIFRQYYAKDEYLFMAKPYHGLFSLLRELKLAGAKIAVATNKRHDYAIRLLEHSCIAPYCDIMHGSDSSVKVNKKTVILHCLGDFQVDNLNACVLVGDTVHDAQGAYDVGIKFIGVTYGFGLKAGDTLSGNDIEMTNSMEELKKLLLELN